MAIGTIVNLTGSPEDGATITSAPLFTGEMAFDNGNTAYASAIKIYFDTTIVVGTEKKFNDDPHFAIQCPTEVFNALSSGSHTWHAVLYNAVFGDIYDTSAPRSFTKPGGLSKPTNPSPANGAGPGIDFSSRTLSWENGGGAETYTVRIGPYPIAYNAYSISQTGTSYVIPEADISLYKNNPIIWRVDAEAGEETVKGDVWVFDPRPAKPTTPTPENEASDQKLTQTLEWIDGGASSTYDVWFGSHKILIDSEDISCLVPDEYITYTKDYTWRVDAINIWGTTKGDEWTFTTFSIDPPSPVFYYPDGNYWWYPLVLEDGEWGDGPPIGTENIDYMITGNINMMSAHRKLMACAADRLWYEV